MLVIACLIPLIVNKCDMGSTTCNSFHYYHLKQNNINLQLPHLDLQIGYTFDRF